MIAKMDIFSQIKTLAIFLLTLWKHDNTFSNGGNILLCFFYAVKKIRTMNISDYNKFQTLKFRTYFVLNRLIHIGNWSCFNCIFFLFFIGMWMICMYQIDFSSYISQPADNFRYIWNIVLKGSNLQDTVQYVMGNFNDLVLHLM